MAAEHVIDIVVETKDNVSPGLDRAKKKLNGFEKSIEKTQARLNAFAKADYEVVLRAIDRITPASGKARDTLRSLAGRTYNATISAIDRTAIKVREAQARLTALTSKAWMVTIAAKNTVAAKASGAVSGAVQSVTGMGGQMLAGAGIGYGIYDTIKTYKDFQAQMSTVAAISGATGTELDALTEKAKEMGASTSFSASDAGKAFEYMAMAGWKSGEMISGISGIMDLAAASGEDLGRVSDIVTDALTAFGLQAADSGHFADVLAAASSNSNTNVSMMGETFKYVAPLAGSLGYSIEDVSVAIGILANSGIKGEKAGTGLTAVFNGLSSPTKQAKAAMDELGISMFDSAGKARPLRDMIGNLREAFAGLSQEEKMKYAYDLAGVDGMKTIQLLVNASASDYEKLTEAIANADGAARKMAETRMDNLAGDMEQLGGAWETFQLSIMEGKGAEGLRSFVSGVTKDIEHLTEYMKDGFDISDVGRLALDILTQLKNKFLELDGIGSILAGGVLAGALYKIAGLARKAGQFIKDASSGGGSSAAEGGLPSVKSMVVHAQSVVVNGGSGTGSAVPDVGGSKGGGKASAPKGRARFGGILGRAAAVVGLGLGAYEAYNIHQENQQSLAEAQNAFDNGDVPLSHVKEVERENTNRMGASVGSTGGALAGGFAGAKAGAAIGGGIGALFGGVGAAPGAAIGGVIGGIGGAIGGSMLGESIGKQFAEISEAASTTWSSIKSGASDTWSQIGSAASSASSYVGTQWSAFKGYVGDALSPVRERVEDTINVIVGLGATVWEEIKPYWDEGKAFASEVWQSIRDTAQAAWDGIKESISAAWDTICEFFAPAGDWFLSSVWQPISDLASAAWDVIRETIITAWDNVCAVWDAVAGWFDATVWQPISSAVDSVRTAITDAFQSAYNTVTELFGGIADWFDKNVISPVKEKFDALRRKGAEITGLQGSGGSEAAHAAGGIFFAPHRGLVAENGPEAVIPLGDRNRGLDLLARTATMMGVDFGDGIDDAISGGDAGDVVPVNTSLTTGSGSQSVSVDMGGISIPITISGGSGDAQAVVQTIRENLEVIADDIGGQLAEKVASIFGNQPVMNAG
ncbi:phage tail tape measure protein [uncultured Selenomonas sp.]|uniref:phage tail tape measure protein n=1 Tax=uncultured Selenomonas sp. TaxID=159275 RepID=UPI0026757B2D|nr:phage tail tape measure protein [uncultured Selenomonas sp.]